MGDGTKVNVECLASQRYPEKPLRLFLDSISHSVSRVRSEARTPLGYRFEVEDQYGEVFQLFYEELHDEWTVTNGYESNA